MTPATHSGPATFSRYVLRSVMTLGVLAGLSQPALAIEGDTVVFSALDKITARITQLEIPVGGSQQFGTLDIHPKSCDKRPPEETPETTAFVEVFDIPLETSEEESENESKLIFSGWMFASTPGLNAVEHPVYDAWVIDCKMTSGDASADN